MLGICLYLSVIAFAICLICATSYFFTDESDLDYEECSWVAFVVLSLVALASVILLFAQMDKPQAIDVYKGNTTLEITYKDGLPTDSVVVYKD